MPCVLVAPSSAAVEAANALDASSTPLSCHAAGRQPAPSVKCWCFDVSTVVLCADNFVVLKQLASVCIPVPMPKTTNAMVIRTFALLTGRTTQCFITYMYKHNMYVYMT